MFNRCESCHCYFVLVILKNDPVTLSVFGVLKQCDVPVVKKLGLKSNGVARVGSNPTRSD